MTEGTQCNMPKSPVRVGRFSSLSSRSARSHCLWKKEEDGSLFKVTMSRSVFYILSKEA